MRTTAEFAVDDDVPMVPGQPSRAKLIYTYVKDNLKHGDIFTGHDVQRWLGMDHTAKIEGFISACMFRLDQAGVTEPTGWDHTTPHRCLRHKVVNLEAWIRVMDKTSLGSPKGRKYKTREYQEVGNEHVEQEAKTLVNGNGQAKPEMHHHEVEMPEPELTLEDRLASVGLVDIRTIHIDVLLAEIKRRTRKT